MGKRFPVCGCHPGSDENGWHETRSAKCRQEELDAWGRLPGLTRDVIAVLKDRGRS